MSGAGSPSMRSCSSALTRPGRGFSRISIMVLTMSMPISPVHLVDLSRSGECSGVYTEACVGSL